MELFTTNAFTGLTKTSDLSRYPLETGKAIYASVFPNVNQSVTKCSIYCQPMLIVCCAKYLYDRKEALSCEASSCGLERAWWMRAWMGTYANACLT